MDFQIFKMFSDFTPQNSHGAQNIQFLAVADFTEPSVIRRFRQNRRFEKFVLRRFRKKTLGIYCETPLDILWNLSFGSVSKCICAVPRRIYNCTCKYVLPENFTQKRPLQNWFEFDTFLLYFCQLVCLSVRPSDPSVPGGSSPNACVSTCKCVP